MPNSLRENFKGEGKMKDKEVVLLPLRLHPSLSPRACKYGWQTQVRIPCRAGQKCRFPGPIWVC